MRIATAGLLLAALIVASACSNKAATSSGAATPPPSAAASPADATDTSAPTATPDDSAASPAPVGSSVDPSKLGAPVYPGAQPDPGSQAGISAQTPEGSTYIGMFKTMDGFDKVYAYYKSQMPAGSEGMKLSMGGASSAMWQVGKDGAPDEVLVQVNSDKTGKVSILITHVIKNNASPAPSPT
jgi:hypothetical protein